MVYTCSGCEREFKRIPKRVQPFGPDENGMHILFLLCRRCYKKYPFSSYNTYRKRVVQLMYDEGIINKDNKHGLKTSQRDHNTYLTTLIRVPLTLRSDGLVSNSGYERSWE